MATMAEQIDEQRRMISDLTARIEGIEKRQAKLACSENSAVADDDGGNETKDWDTLANMLGMETVAWMVGFVGEINMYGFEDDGKAERNLKAMLIGLAEEECNGNVWKVRSISSRDGDWCWSLGHDDYETGRGLSRPAAAIDMLKAYREDQ